MKDEEMNCQIGAPCSWCDPKCGFYQPSIVKNDVDEKEKENERTTKKSKK